MRAAKVGARLFVASCDKSGPYYMNRWPLGPDKFQTLRRAWLSRVMMSMIVMTMMVTMVSYGDRDEYDDYDDYDEYDEYFFHKLRSLKVVVLSTTL